MYRLIFITLLVLCAAGMATAKRVAWLDRPHDAVSAGIFAVSDRFDRFFDATADEEIGDTRVKLTTGTEWREGSGLRFTTGAGARIDLPRMERRLNLILENIELSEDTIPEQDVGDDFSTGLRLLLRRTRRSLVHIDGGLRFSNGPMLFGRTRMRRQYGRDPHMLRATQFFQWFDREGFSTISRLEYEQRLQTNWLLYSRSQAEWGEQTDGVDWSQRLSLANIHQEQLGLEAFVSAEGVTRPVFEAHRYFVGIRIRYRLYRDWLYLDVTPGVEFDHEDNYKSSPVVKLAIETIFHAIKPNATDGSATESSP